MGGKKENKKIVLLFHHTRRFLSVKVFVIAVILVGLAAAAAVRYGVIYGKNAVIFSKQTVFVSENETAASKSIIYSEPETSLASASSSASVVSSLNLSGNIAVYVLSKKTGPCKDYRNTLQSRAFGLRCKTADALWRGLWVKKIDVFGYSKLRINAHLKVNDYTDYFAECGHKGVNRDDFVDLIILSSDPNHKLSAECNHVVGAEKWSECYIGNNDPSAITHCGIQKCAPSKSCDMEIDVSDRKAVYLLFSVSDAWVADIEGILSDVKITLTK